MSVTLINAEGLPQVDIYHHVAVTTGSKTVYLAGQVDWTGAADLATQVENAYVNVHTALKAAGASFQDLARVRVYVVDWTPDKMPELLKGMENAMARVGETAQPPATLIGVAALDVPEHLVEIEAVASID
ncbi:Enamine deaminase RidA, house cleaning of reactive enamine intermediates, YjgF/YER057c/UK114 family [Lentzea fradiae]|uniref:Enamine deaminase RidA, house cleaning of reactive enamine intermediates, YjgF/YER057c/UK114 family n=1 Tax=Lentzea fradiae TaxID=200378 RepID=A0A1G7P3U1_9PSEU|nr:RidA family protein [Lentzea fradiae]SDF80289.1 Enamine deaminase RidA, house cleaning of reactive enamine intermediates, YjgF/YER057c/UK114 family [Lentzea fradiae]